MLYTTSYSVEVYGFLDAISNGIYTHYDTNADANMKQWLGGHVFKHIE